jgi:hypothetical protein
MTLAEHPKIFPNVFESAGIYFAWGITALASATRDGTLLHKAADDNDKAGVDMLLEQGANPKHAQSTGGQSCIVRRRTGIHNSRDARRQRCRCRSCRQLRMGCASHCSLASPRAPCGVSAKTRSKSVCSDQLQTPQHVATSGAVDEKGYN